jgi:hypothetical protein
MHTLQVTSAQQFGGTTSSGQRREGLTIHTRTCDRPTTDTGMELIINSISFFAQHSCSCSSVSKTRACRVTCAVVSSLCSQQPVLLVHGCFWGRLLVSWHVLVACGLHRDVSVRLPAACPGTSRMFVEQLLVQLPASARLRLVLECCVCSAMGECCRHLRCNSQVHCCLFV